MESVTTGSVATAAAIASKRKRETTSVDGGAGEDDLSYLGAPTGVTVDLGRAGPQDTGGAGVDTIAEIENIEGTDHADTLTGNAGFNYVISNGGDDLLDGAAGDDAITGGDGNDAVTYARAPGAVTVDLSASSGTGYGNDGIAEVESVIGSPFDDRLVGTDESNSITGLGGTDSISALAGADTVDVRDGEARHRELRLRDRHRHGRPAGAGRGRSGLRGHRLPAGRRESTGSFASSSPPSASSAC